MQKSKENDLTKFENPLAVIQAAVDLLSRDPNNQEKIKMVCRIISEQTRALSGELSERLEEELTLSKAN